MEKPKTDPTIYWCDEEIQRIYREWAIFFSGRQQLSNAEIYYEKSLSLKANDEKSLYRRSICYGHCARVDDALNDVQVAYKINEYSSPICLQHCDALFDKNLFSRSLSEAYYNYRKFKGHKKKSYEELMQVLELTLTDSLGDGLLPFMYKEQKIFEKARWLWDEKERELKDDRLLYRKLMELGKCDVLSIPEEEKIILEPREIERRKLLWLTFVQMYFNRTSQDIFFLQKLITSKIINLKQTPKSSAFISSTAQEKFSKILIFLRMLQQRSPKYNEKYRNCPIEKKAIAYRERNLFRVQDATRTALFKGLNKMRRCRKAKNLEEMVLTIDLNLRQLDVKPYRIMPIRFEILNEYCNLLGLGYIDRLVVPKNILKYPVEERCAKLLGLVKPKDTYRKYVFGDKSTFIEPDAVDCKYVAYKNRVMRYEVRLKTIKYPIEKAYVLHAIGMEHLSNYKFEEAFTVAKRSIKESIRCRNFIWIFLGKLMFCRICAATGKVEKLHETLLDMMFVAKKLNQVSFIETLNEFNKAVLKQKYGDDWFNPPPPPAE